MLNAPKITTTAAEPTPDERWEATHSASLDPPPVVLGGPASCAAPQEETLERHRCAGRGGLSDPPERDSGDGLSVRHFR